MDSLPTSGPVFILAPLPRSGTNFLWELLRRHPDCAPGRSPIWEDYLLRNAHHLQAFAAAAQQSWDPVWGPTGHLQGELLHSLGDAVVRFLTIHPGRRVVTKSPTLDNLELFFDVFADAYAVLLIRDGRDVAHSGMATFGWTLEGAARAWAGGVDRVMRFVDRDDVPDDRCVVVRYEDLFAETAPELRRVLRALRLDPRRYDFAQLDDVPVRGSSTHRGEGRDDIHWNPVPRTAAFNPVQRWRTWEPDAQQRFASAAGPQLARLGYEV